MTTVPIATYSPISCSNCQACCCRLEVILISKTGVPEYFVDTNNWGARVMARLEDGWCAALDRDTFRCSIYDRRPVICRDFEMGSHECQVERARYSLRDAPTSSVCKGDTDEQA